MPVPDDQHEADSHALSAVADLVDLAYFRVDADRNATVESGERMEGWAARLRGADGTETPVSFSIGQLDSTESCGGLGGRYVVMMRPETDLSSPSEFHGLVSHSPAMQRIFRLPELLRAWIWPTPG